MYKSLALIALAVILSSTAPAPAQFNLRQNTGMQLSPGGAGTAQLGSNPYAPVTSGANISGSGMNMSNPYNQFNPYNPWFPTWYPDPIGSTLYGSASLLNAYGQTIINQEQARIGREAARSAWLENEKRRFDLEKYIRDNTPTFTDEQLKYAKVRLRRIQLNSNINEVASGTALNVLLDDLKNFRGRISGLEPIPMSADVLRRLNVSGNTGNMGLLRNEGRFTWPQAIRDILPEDERKSVEVQTQVLVQQAVTGKVDQNVLENLRVAIDEIRERLMTKANAVPTSQYLEAKRFLTSFDSARRGLQDGDAVPYFKYQNFVKDGRSLQQVVDYMLTEGLRFAPAVQGDEAAYRAVYDALAAVDVAFNGGTP